MIQHDDLVIIGRFGKSHGIKGEITFHFTSDSFDSEACPFLICELDGIFVPFRVEKMRFISGSTALVQLKNRTSETEVRSLAHKKVYFPKKYLKYPLAGDSYSWDYFIGFTLIDEQRGEIGSISDVDTSTLNTLFIIQKENDELLIPATDDMITRVDENQKKIYVDLPEGLIFVSL